MRSEVVLPRALGSRAVARGHGDARRGPRFGAVLLVLASCSSAPTEIVLSIDTDLESADAFRARVVHPDGDVLTADADLSELPPPRTLVLVHRGGPLGPVQLAVEATEGGATLVAVEREVTFALGRSLRLEVFLPESCRRASCGVGWTCGSRGECRSPRVPSCEWEGQCPSEDAGADAGAPDGEVDGGERDAGPCTLTGRVCAVSSEHLPGDRILPVPCLASPDEITTRVDGPTGPLVPVRGGFLLERSGAYTVRIERLGDPRCGIERTVAVVAPDVVPDARPVSADELRDLAARVGTAFVAGQRGGYAVDPSGWHSIRAVPTGAALPDDLRAVAVFRGQPIFGPSLDMDAVYRVVAEAPYDAATVSVTPIVLPAGQREVRAIDARLDAGGGVLVSTRDGAVIVTNADAVPSASQSGSPYDPTIAGFGALGALEPPTRGAAWLGAPTEIVNRSVGGAPTFNAGSPAALPAWLGRAHEAEVDDRDPAEPVLWVCGDGGVALWALGGDFGARTELGPPTRLWTGVCEDLAIGANGDAWVAAGTEGLVRLDRTATRIVTYSLAGASIDLVSAVFDGARREVWMLDATSSPRAILVLSAENLP